MLDDFKDRKKYNNLKKGIEQNCGKRVSRTCDNKPPSMITDDNLLPICEHEVKSLTSRS